MDWSHASVVDSTTIVRIGIGIHTRRSGRGEREITREAASGIGAICHGIFGSGAGISDSSAVIHVDSRVDTSRVGLRESGWTSPIT